MAPQRRKSVPAALQLRGGGPGHAMEEQTKEPAGQRDLNDGTLLDAFLSAVCVLPCAVLVRVGTVK